MTFKLFEKPFISLLERFLWNKTVKQTLQNENLHELVT